MPFCAHSVVHKPQRYDWNDRKWLTRASRIDNLNSVMKAERLTQSALARKLGVNQSTISRWVKAQTRPHKQALRDLANLWKSCGYSLDV